MAEVHDLAAGIAQRSVVGRFIGERFRPRVEKTGAQSPSFLGCHVSGRLAAFGRSWTFSLLAILFIAVWMMVNAHVKRAFDPYPFVLLNLVLSCVAILQARADAQHDYEVNAKAELEIAELHARLNEIRKETWSGFLTLQEQQMKLLAQVSSPPPPIGKE